jgi:hypothetical protein
MIYKIVKVDEIHLGKWEKQYLVGETFDLKEIPQEMERFRELHGHRYLTTTPIQYIEITDKGFNMRTTNTLYYFERD